MDDKLILAVFNCPELYNVTLPNYRCTESRVSAWRNISIIMGLSSEECKRKWKNLRDRYLKEVRMELKNKQQGDVVQSRWKYRQLLNFLAPFTGSRNGTAENGSNNGDDHDNLDNESGGLEAETASLEAAVKTPQPIIKVPASPDEPKPQVAFATQLPPMSQDAHMTQLAILTKTPSAPHITPIAKPGRKRRLLREALSLPSSQTTQMPAKWLHKDDVSISGRPRDEDELFLLSFVPALKRLAPQKRCETKIKIQQIMYEAEFNVTQPGSQDKQPEHDKQH